MSTMLGPSHFRNKRVASNIGRSIPSRWSLFSSLWRRHHTSEICLENDQEAGLRTYQCGSHPVTDEPNSTNVRSSHRPSVNATLRPDSGDNVASLNHSDRVKEPFTIANQLRRTVLSSWINTLILAAPFGIALNYLPSVSRTVVFFLNFVAIVPLAAMLGFATEEVALRTGDILGGLINATFGNAVELIVAIIALKANKVAIVQMSLIGSVLSNVLLVTGFCFLLGGSRRREQYFNSTFAQTAASLLVFAAASVIIPSVFNIAIPDVGQNTIAKISRGTSVILLVVYLAFLVFQLHTHQKHFKEESQKVPAESWSGNPVLRTIRQAFAKFNTLTNQPSTDQTETQENQDGEEPKLHFLVALAVLLISTVIIAFCAECMVGSIDAVSREGGLTQKFVALILLPIVGNAAEHVTAVTVAMKDKMDLAIGVAVGSSLQVALFLLPLLVVIGWAMDNMYMDLSFDYFQIAVLFVAVLLLNSVIGDSRSHWFEGMMLLCLYSVIAVCSFWYPNEILDKTDGQSKL